MDKGLKIRGRMRFALVVAICAAAVLALPAFAHAAVTNPFPADGADFNAKSVTVGALFTGTYTDADLKAADVVAVDGDNVPAVVRKTGSTLGSWSVSYSAPDTNGKITATWTWTPGAVAAGSVSVYGNPTDLAVGSHTAVLTLGADTVSISFDIVADETPVPPTSGTSKNPGCTAATCHANSGNGYDGHGANSCLDCHGVGTTWEAAHYTSIPEHDAIDKSNSSACVACHGSNYLNILEVPGEHKGCSCHAYGYGQPSGPQAAKDTCADCHSGSHAAHGFEENASGHNAGTYTNVGAKSMFDGSQGVTLKVEAERAFTSMPATYFVEAGFQAATTPLGWVGKDVAIGDETTMTSKWDLPTAQTFWGSDDPSAPPSAIKGLTWNSVVTCEDCHTDVVANGPQGAAGNWGLDARYPAEYSMAVLSKQVTDNFSAAGLDGGFPAGIAIRSSLTTGSVLANRINGAVEGQGVICAKCHDLANQVPLIAGAPIVDKTPAVGGNTGHNSHHQDATDGSDQCVSCHIGVPHGWKVPRMLVNTAISEAPYLDPKAVGTTRTTNGVDMYRFDGTNWNLLPKPYATAASITADPVTFAGYSNITGAYNREGMQSLSGVDNHIAIKNGTDIFPAAGLNSVNTDDMIYWSEAGCKACNDHTGEDEIRIVDAE